MQIWTQIPLSLRKMSLSQSILEISDFTLEKNDPYPNLFNILIKTFKFLKVEISMKIFYFGIMSVKFYQKWGL